MTTPSTTLLTVDEAASVLRCSRTHVYRLIRGKHLRAVDISAPGSVRSKSRIRSDDLARYIERSSQTGRASASGR